MERIGTLPHDHDVFRCIIHRLTLLEMYKIVEVDMDCNNCIFLVVNSACCVQNEVIRYESCLTELDGETP